MSASSSRRRLISTLLAPALAVAGLAFASAPAAAAPTTFSYTGPAVAIPDNNAAGVSVPLAVSGLGSSLTDVNLRFDGASCNADQGSTTVGLDHPFVGDLVIRLTSPDGTTVTLVDRIGIPGSLFGFDGKNFCQLTLDDAAANGAIEGATAEPVTGSFTPNNPLSAFNGTNPNGTWTLNVSDNVIADAGSIRAFSLIIDSAPAAAPDISGPATATATVESPFTYTPTVTGSPTPTITQIINQNFDALPTGLTLNADGTITGTPAAGTQGTYAIRLRASNSAGNDTLNFQLTVDIVPPSLLCDYQVGTAGQAFSYTPTFTGTPAPEITTRPGSQAVPGLSLNQSTGLISGNLGANSGGVYNIKLQAANGSPLIATCVFTITVNQAPSITGDGTATGTVGQAFTYTPTVTGFPAPAVELRAKSDALPDGLSLNSSTGVITGTPQPGSRGEYAIKLRATNSAGSDNKNLSLTINEAPIITGPATATGTVGDPLTYTPTLLDGFPPPTVSVNPNGDALPSDLSVDPATGVISGTPAAGTGGVYNITLTATNSAGSYDLNVELTISEAPTIEGPSTATGRALEPFTYSPTTLTGSPASTVVLRAVSDPLPDGLSLDPDSGVITGTPALGSDGTYDIRLAARNGVAPNDQLDVTLTILKATITGLDPTISGRAQAGQTLTADPGNVVPPNANLTYQWKADGTPIAGGTGPTLRLRRAQAGATITVAVTASAPGYETATATSDPTPYVRDRVRNPQVSAPSPVYRGDTVTVLGQGLTPGAAYTVSLYFSSSVTVVADEYGEIHAPLHIPPDARTGKAILTLTGPGPVFTTTIIRIRR